MLEHARVDDQLDLGVHDERQHGAGHGPSQTLRRDRIGEADVARVEQRGHGTEVDQAVARHHRQDVPAGAAIELHDENQTLGRLLDGIPPQPADNLGGADRFVIDEVVAGAVTIEQIEQRVVGRRFAVGHGSSVGRTDTVDKNATSTATL